MLLGRRPGQRAVGFCDQAASRKIESDRARAREQARLVPTSNLRKIARTRASSSRRLKGLRQIVISTESETNLAEG